ncbi:MAG: hypothetical protein NC927_00140 [Candidatus Omnitrophica bacterium]|nr:hypothetical protein [Candidatus Omnitrophota bacterium]
MLFGLQPTVAGWGGFDPVRGVYVVPFDKARVTNNTADLPKIDPTHPNPDPNYYNDWSPPEKPKDFRDYTDLYDYLSDAVTEAKKSTVICTELYRYGFIPEHIYEADARYGASLPRQVIRGYHLWGKPIARMMQKSRVFAYFVYILARPWIQQMAYEMGATDRGSKLGKLMIKIGEPFCAYLGEGER